MNIHNNEFINQIENKFDIIVTHNKMLETQSSKVAQQQTSTSSPSDTFPRQPQPNPKGHLSVVTLRSRKKLEVVIDKSDKGKDTESETLSTEKERKHTSKENEVVEEDKEEPYVPPTPYEPSISFP